MPFVWSHHRCGGHVVIWRGRFGRCRWRWIDLKAYGGGKECTHKSRSTSKKKTPFGYIVIGIVMVLEKDKWGREIVVVIVCYSLLSGRRTDRCVQNGKCFQQD